MADDLFTGTATYYARYRPAYPAALLVEIERRFALDRTGRLLDLGCGPGTLTIALAGSVLEAVGVDPEPEMLEEAARQARAAGVGNVTWMAGRAEDLPHGLGQFDLVTMGRSFHWTARERVLAALDPMVAQDGGLVIVNDNCLIRPTTDWQRTVEEIQARFLGPVRRAGSGVFAHPAERHEMILDRSPFRSVERIVHEFDRVWTIDRIIGYLYTTSFPVRRLLGDRRAAFEEQIAAALLALTPHGKFVEPVALEAIFASRDG